MTPHFDELDISSSRTKVRINQFNLGEDILRIQNLGDQAPEITAVGGGKINIAFNKDNADPSTIAEINIDSKSLEELDRGGRSKINYISDMFYESPINSGIWELGRYANHFPLKQLPQNTRYTGGPASTNLIVDRGTKSLDRIFISNTFSGDDQIIGTQGNEEINTGDGRDIIYPSSGKDTIDAGNGIDYVAIADIRQPVSIEYDRS